MPTPERCPHNAHQATQGGRAGQQPTYRIAHSQSQEPNDTAGLQPVLNQPCAKQCPVCDHAAMVRCPGTPHGKPWAFYGCPNCAFGCDYREWIRLHAPVQPA